MHKVRSTSIFYPTLAIIEYRSCHIIEIEKKNQYEKDSVSHNYSFLTLKLLYNIKIISWTSLSWPFLNKLIDPDRPGHRPVWLVNRTEIDLDKIGTRIGRTKTETETGF